MKEKKAQKTHWILTNSPEQNKETSQKIGKFALVALGSLVLSVGSFLLLMIPNIGPVITMISVLSGVSFLAVLTNSAKKASNLYKEQKTEKQLQKILNKSVEKLSKKELEIYDQLYPKPQLVHIEHPEPRQKIDYNNYYEEISVIEP